MATFEQTQRATRTYNTLCASLDRRGWVYDRDDSKLTVKSGASGDDLPMDLLFSIDTERQLVQMYSPISFTVNEDKRIDFALAVTAINSGIVDGCFDYNITNGKLIFRITSSFIGSELSEDVFSYMLYCICSTVDEYNDKLLMLAKGELSFSDFLGE